MTFRTAYLFFLIVLAGLVATARADIYQYVDDSGVVHFTNVPGATVKRPTRVRVENRNVSSRSIASSAARRTLDADEIPASYQQYITIACDKYGVDPSLVQALVKVESDFNPFALSRKGAMGLMQLMPQTASDMNVKNSFSPKDNIEGGVRYLRYLLDRYEGNLSLALAAYNSGETAVKRWGTVPPFKETRNYVKRILAIYHGTGKTTLVPRYTIYVGYGPDGSLLLTDNPSSHPDRRLHQRLERNL